MDVITTTYNSLCVKRDTRYPFNIGGIWTLDIVQIKIIYRGARIFFKICQ